MLQAAHHSPWSFPENPSPLPPSLSPFPFTPLPPFTYFSLFSFSLLFSFFSFLSLSRSLKPDSTMCTHSSTSSSRQGAGACAYASCRVRVCACVRLALVFFASPPKKLLGHGSVSSGYPPSESRFCLPFYAALLLFLFSTLNKPY